MRVKYSFIIVTFQRDKRLLDTLERLMSRISIRDDWEIILVDNNADSFDRSTLLQKFPVKIVKSEKNIGCTGGRNLGISHASGEFLVFIDDDALMVTGDPLSHLDRIFKDKEVGAVAFKSIDNGTGSIDPKEFPHTNKLLDPEVPFETFRFIGVGHALRASAISKVGGFREDYFYGMEEFELCFRLMKEGFSIKYEPSLHVLHMKDISGRLQKVSAVERHVVNKIKTAWIHLPTHLAVLSATAWTVRGIRLSRGKINLASVYREIKNWIAKNKALRDPLPPHILKKISDMGGEVWK